MVVRDVGVLQSIHAGTVVVVTGAATVVGGMVVVGATVVVGASVVTGVATVVVTAIVVVGATVVAGTTVVGAGNVVVTGAATGETSNAENASRFGLPAPMLNTAPLVAFAMSICSTCCCVRVGLRCSIVATMPETIGAAFDVPLLERYVFEGPTHPATDRKSTRLNSSHRT